MSTMRPRHKAARSYAMAGIPVFPCKSDGKEPAVNGGIKAATTDLGQIDEWWTKYEWNIGADPHGAGYCAIDAESNADPKWLAKLPLTFTILTPRGGFHFWYEGVLPSTVQKLGPHIDTRGSGTGYVLLPPSTVDGKPYTVHRKGDVAPLPRWIKIPERTRPAMNGHDFEYDAAANVNRAITYLNGLPLVKERDGADAKTYATAAALRELGLTSDKIFELMLEHYKIEPKDERLTLFLQTKIQNAFEYATNPPGISAGISFEKMPAVQEAAKAQTQTKIVSQLASDIPPKQVQWLWPNRFPKGKLSIVAGNQDLGKTTVLLDMAARVSRGGDWPNGEGKVHQGSVLYFSAEDTPDDTIVPRLMAAGADLKQVHIVECVRTEENGNKTFSLVEDLAELDRLMAEIGNVRLVIFDPISSYFGKTTGQKVDTFRDSEVRGVLEPLVRVARNRGIAIIGNSHLSKLGKGAAMSRVLGSVAMTATGRAGYLVTVDPDDTTRRLFLRGKGNLGPPVDGLAFRIKSKFVTADITGTFVEWERGAVKDTADEVMAELDKEIGKPSPALNEAADWLKQFLANGPKTSAEVWTAAENNGHAPATVRRAVKKIGIRSDKKDLKSGWIMSLPN